MQEFQLGNEVDIRLRGKIVGVSNDYSDGMTRYMVNAGHCINATVLKSALSKPTYACHDCGRLYEIEEFVERYIPRRNDVPDHEIICKECAGIKKEAKIELDS